MQSAAPVDGMDVPPGQGVQANTPAPELYVPTGHCAQIPADSAPEAVEYFPHPHWVHTRAPVDDMYVPPGQEAQATEADIPVPVLYVPARQGRQAAMPTPVLYAPAGHKLHSSLPVELAKVPSSQLKQELDFTQYVYFPVAQGMQLSADCPPSAVE
jgi:hypothetical protein